MNSTRLVWLLTIAVLASYAALVPWRAPILEPRGDEGTYLSMAESLAEDFDLRFDERDRSRFEGDPPGRSTVILQRGGDGRLAYSKPILYSLAAAPFSALFGDFGPVLLNALAFFLALLLAHGFLRRLEGGERALWVLLTFVGASVLLPYVFWRMSDLFQTSLALAGLSLCFARFRGPAPDAGRLQRLLDWRGADLLGMTLLALLTSMRIPNGTLAVVPVLALVFARHFRRAALLAAVGAVAFLAMAGLTDAMTGASSPYRANRTSFNQETGYPVGENAAERLEQFETKKATVWTGIRPSADPHRVVFSTLYFLAGRHSGLLFYFPAALILLIAGWRSLDRFGLALWIGFAGSAVFYLGWLPWNYFGGDTFIGNRYILAAYPALLLAPRCLPGRRSLLAAWILALIALGSALVSAGRVHDQDRTSQNHAYAGVFRMLPYESTAQDISGRRDRYWAEHFLRFVDPFARVFPGHFEIQAGDPAAELLLAQWDDEKRPIFLASASSPDVTLTISDYRNTRTYDLGPPNSEHWLEFDLSPAWRRHVFWWPPAEILYKARSLRFQIETADGSPATAQIRYVRTREYWDEAFAYEMLSSNVPATPSLGATSTVTLKLRNTSSRSWKRQDVFPVYAKYRFFTEDSETPAFESRPIQLPVDEVPKQGGLLDLTLDIEWPEQPGRYRFEADLILSRINWFQDRLGHPILRQEVEIAPLQD